MKWRLFNVPNDIRVTVKLMNFDDVLLSPHVLFIVYYFSFFNFEFEIWISEASKTDDSCK